MKKSTFFLLIAFVCISTIGYSQTYTTSAAEMFSNENNAPNDLTFTFNNIQDCITSDITMEVCVRGDLDGDCSNGACFGEGNPCPGCSAVDETATVFLNGVSTGVVLGNTDETSFMNGGGGFCEPICQIITIPCDAAAIAVATGTLTVLFSTGPDVNSAVPNCPGAPGTIRFAAEIIELTYNGDQNISFSGQTNFCATDNFNEIITAEGTCGVIGGFSPATFPGFMDNGDNTATFNPNGVPTGSYTTTFSYLCGTTLYSEDLVINVLDEPMNLSIVPSDICNTGDNSLTLQGDNVPGDGTLLVWSGMGAAAPFVTDSGTAADTTGTFLAGAPPGMYTVCVDISDGLGGTCFMAQQFCETVTVSSGPTIPTSVEIDLLCQVDQIGDVALTELFFGLSNEVLASAVYTVSGGSIVGGAFVYDDFECFSIQAVGNTGSPCFTAFDITSYVFVSEEAQPNFDMQDQACWSNGDPGNLITPVVTSPTYTGTVARSWARSGTDITGGTFNTTNGSFTVSDTGTMTVTLTEIVTTTQGVCTGANTCTSTFSQVITVEDGTSLNPTFNPSSNPICANDVITLTPVVNGGVFTGSGVTDNGLGTGGTFTAALPGIYSITYTLNSPNGCTNSYTLNVTVYGAVDASLTDLHIECVINPSGNVSLSSLFTGTTTSGGTFSLISATGTGSVSGGTLTYSTSGCFEIEYVADQYTGATGACADMDTAFVLISEEPQPSFDIQDQVCWSASDAGTHLYTPTINSPIYDSSVTRTWSVVSGPASINNVVTGEILVTGAGIVVLRLTEEIPYAACGDFAAGNCSEFYEVNINVEDGTAQNAAFTIDITNPCISETVTLTPSTQGGYFTGIGVVNNMPGIQGQFTPPSCGTFAVSYVLNSSNGCSAIYTLNITTDLTDPVIGTAPTNMSVECDGSGNATALNLWIASNGGGVATDNCAGTLTWEYDLVSEVDLCEGTGENIYRFTVSDVCGNTASAQASFIITDTTKPNLTPPADITISCSDISENQDPSLIIDDLINQARNSMTDNCDTDPVFEHNYDNTLLDICALTAYDITITWTATDACNNDSISMTVITVEPDTIIPVITPPANISLDCSSLGATTDASAIIDSLLAAVVVTDNCDSDPVLTHSFGNSLIDVCADANYNIVITWNATDACGNAALTQTTTITIVPDVTAPIITCPLDGTGDTEMVDCEGDIAWNHPLPTDDCQIGIYTYTITDPDGTVNGPFDLTGILTSMATATAFDFGEGTSVVSYYVEDLCGNRNACSFNVVVGDIIEPYFLDCPADLFVGNDPDECSAKVNWEVPIAWDNCDIPANPDDIMTDSSLTITQLVGLIDGTEYADFQSGSIIDVGTWAIGYAVIDTDGNTDTCAFNITVWDTQDPVLMAGIPVDITLSCEEVWDTFHLLPHHILDNCTEDLTIDEFVVSTRIMDPADCSYYNYNDTLFWVVTDSVQTLPDGSPKINSMTWKQVVTWEDTEAPEVSLPPDAIVNDCNLDNTSPDLLGYATGIDNCAPSDVLTVSYRDSLEILCEGDQAAVLFRIWRVEDPCGNADSLTQEIIILDQNPPELKCKETFAASLDETGWVILNPEDLIESLTNACLSDVSNITFEVTPSKFNCGDIGTQPVLLSASDPCNDETSFCEVQVTITDDLPPLLTCPIATIVINVAEGDCTGALPPLSSFLGGDDCNVSLTAIPAIADGLPVGIHTITLEATDASGNASMCTFDVDVQGEPIDFSETLVCSSNINVSLGSKCTVSLRPELLIEGTALCTQFLCIEVKDKNGNLHDNFFDLSDVNKEFQVRVIDCNGSGNSCWSTVLIEEKLIPEVEWPADKGILCIESTAPSGSAGEPKILSCETDIKMAYSDEFLQFERCDEIRAQIKRTWMLDDNDGNIIEHIQQIDILPFMIEDVRFPSNRGIDDPIDCRLVSETKHDIETGQIDSESPIHPNQSGEPRLGGLKLNTNGGLCLFSLRYDDDLFEICDGSFEILRTWKVRNVCEDVVPGLNPFEHVQVITVFDNEAQDFSACVEDITVSTDPWICTYNGILPLPEMLDDQCGTNTVDAYISGGGYLEIEGSLAEGNLKITAYELTTGLHEVTYVTRDDCYNIGLCKYYITVIDDVAPIAIALENIVISLGRDGQDGVAKLFKESVNNGSYDGCTEVFLEIRKEDGAQCGNPGNFTYNNDGHSFDDVDDDDNGEYVKFCCDDLDLIDENGIPYGEVKVWLRVWDDADEDGVFGSAGDKYAETWSTVRVEYKDPPTIIAPDDITVFCDILLDDLETLGIGYAISLCEVPELEYYDLPELNICGIGTVIRRWHITGDSSNYDEQIIKIDALSPFDGGIEWPENVETNCLDEDFGEPDFISGVCASIATSLKTDTLYISGEACYLILRHWKIIDWCQYIPGDNNSLGVWEHTQTIKVFDDSAPTLLMCDDVMFAADDFDDLNQNGEICEAIDVTLTNKAMDEGDCPSKSLRWKIFVDLDSDGEKDYTFTSFVSKNDEFYVAPTASNEEVSITLPEGIFPGNAVHSVEWRVDDGCGNSVTCSTTFMVSDKKAPTPYCIDVSTALMDASQGNFVEVWACDLDAGSYDNCTSQDNLLFTFDNLAPITSLLGETHYFNADGEATKDDYDAGLAQIWNPESNCSGIKFIGEEKCGENAVRITVWDEAFNSDACVVTILIAGNACPDVEIGSRMISGAIRTLNDNPIGSVEVANMTDTPEGAKVSQTTSDGEYAFPSNEMYKLYLLSPSKEDDYLNGVSTLDLLHIIRHILGINPFANPYTYIAADINNDKRVSASDLIVLRKLILGIYNELPNNLSWRFVDTSDPLSVDNVWAYKEYREINGLLNNMDNENFIGIKIGDIDNSAKANAHQRDLSTRSVDELALVIQPNSNGDIMIKAGKDFDQIYGLQMTLNIHNSYQGVVSNALDMNEQNIHAEEDRLTLSYASEVGKNFDEGVVLFTLLGVEHVNVITTGLEAEAYRGAGLEIMNIKLFDPEKFELSLAQNTPNPWNGYTDVKFTIPSSGEVTFVVKDIVGKELWKKSSNYESGEHLIRIDVWDIPSSGILIYEIIHNNRKLSNKMILLK